MRRSFPITAAALAVLIFAACSTAEPPKPVPPPFVARSSTLAITNGIKVLSTVALPAGFAPIASRPPIWLQNSNEIAVVGTQGGHTVVYGLGGPGWRTGRVLAAGDGDGAVEPGDIIDVAASPEGLALATAVVPRDGKRIDIVVRDLIATGSGSIVAGFDGQYDSISMSWLNAATIAVALRKHPETAPPAGSGDPDAPPPPAPADGLQIIVVTGASSVAPLKLDCAMSPLSWSVHGVYAVATGDDSAPAAIIDRRKSTCTRFKPARSIAVLDWSADDEGSFLYAMPDPTQRTVGVFRYNIESGEQHLVAISTGAAAFTGGGEIIALGNQHLTARLAAEHPDQTMLAQVAISQPEQSQVTIRSLGFDSTPAMFAQSTMIYSKGGDQAVLQVYGPSQPVPWRKIVTYSLPTDAAFLVAAGPARGTVTMAWSNKGRFLAILDGDPTVTTLSVLAPPR